MRPWEQANDHGELPGDICCLRATGKYCYEHSKENYKRGPMRIEANNKFLYAGLFCFILAIASGGYCYHLIATTVQQATQ